MRRVSTEQVAGLLRNSNASHPDGMPSPWIPDSHPRGASSELTPPPRPDATIGVDGGIRLTSPDDVVASLGYLLGFQPEHSAVALWLVEGHVRLVQRVDLPSRPGADAPGFHAAIRQGLIRAQATACVLSIVSARGDEHDVPWSELVSTIMQDVQHQDCEIRDALLVEYGESGEHRWWSYLCDQSCCPREGRVVPAEVLTAIAACFAWQGVVMRPSRADVCAELAASPQEQAAISAALASDPQLAAGPTESRQSEREQWRDQSIAHLRSLLALDGGQPQVPISIPERARAIHALADVRVRDTVLWHLVRAADARPALGVLAMLLRGAPANHQAPVATCAGIAAWLCGDGVRASTAVDRALADQPEYGLALLLRQALDAGMSGQHWREAMSGLTEAECRCPVANAPAPGL